MTTTSRLKQKFSLKQVLAASFLAISLPTASIAFAEHATNKSSHFKQDGQSCHRAHDSKFGPAPYLHGLNLTSVQEDQIFTLTHEQMPVVRNQHKQHLQLIEELHATTQSDKFDDAKVQLLADKIAKLEKEKVLTRAHHEASIFALLTPEQRKKAREFKDSNHNFGHNFEQGRHGDGRDDDNNHPTRFKSSNRTFEHRLM
jgi:periplasmic protein CpxP/Spy